MTSSRESIPNLRQNSIHFQPIVVLITWLLITSLQLENVIAKPTALRTLPITTTSQLDAMEDSAIVRDLSANLSMPKNASSNANLSLTSQGQTGSPAPTPFFNVELSAPLVVRKYFKVPLVFDSTAIQALGGDSVARKRASDIVRKMKSIMQDLSPLVLQVPEVHFWSPAQELQAMLTLDFKDEGWQLSAFNAWRLQNISTSHAVAHMFTARPFRNYVDTRVIFAKKSACNPFIAASLSTILGVSDDNVIAKYAVHALAHTIGLDHLTVFSSQGVTMDDAMACMLETGEVMQTPKLIEQFPTNATWSHCSRTWLRMYFEGFPFECVGDACNVPPIYNSRSDYPPCMEAPALKDAFPVCGDGILQPENSEECDCGDAVACKDKCCDAATCKLQSTAKCSANDACCNPQTCAPFSLEDKKLCRAAASVCDQSEICDGSSSKCGYDAYLPLGATCATQTIQSGLCDAKGTCQSISAQCQILMNNPLAKPCPLTRNPKPCQVSCMLPGSRSCVVTKKMVIDGATCAKGKTCFAGGCIASKIKKKVRG